ncbi:MAG TPA: hypothetical protein VG225_15465 [Terracidiphilus sp.]|jgi:hypothetical protein|nr:hypothetical protein [Terracidiphilus sp.]
MRVRQPIRLAAVRLAAAVLLCISAMPARVLAQQPAAPVVLDRVVAVVNNRAILASDLDLELRLSVLEPESGSREVPDRKGALERLISRTLIQQQIRQEEAHAAEPPAAEIDERRSELRRELPACVRLNCASDAGWTAFLAANGLTEAEVDSYLRLRLQILAYIESRFRQGIRIPEEEIESYYQQTLLPQYAPGQAAPALNSVAPRIQEILLQQQVNSLFSAWLDNLRKQGDIEILDPDIDSPGASASQGGGDA